MRGAPRSAQSDANATRWSARVAALVFGLAAVGYALKAHTLFRADLMPGGFHAFMVTMLFVQLGCAVVVLLAGMSKNLFKQKVLPKTWACIGITLLVCMLNSGLLSVYAPA